MQNHLNLNQRNTDQRTRSREDEVKNHAGGYVFAVSDMALVERFLVLGTEGGTFYASESKATKEAATGCLKAVKANGLAVVEKIVEVSTKGQAAKNDPALFLLAMASGEGDDETRRAALEALPLVARTATHLFTFLEYAKQFRGWGRSLKRAVANWYNDKSPNQVAYQAVKYRNRSGWSHRDVLRKAHPSTDSIGLKAVYDWICHDTLVPSLPSVIKDYEVISRTDNVAFVVGTLMDNKSIPWEALPTTMLREPTVWAALLPNMPLTALVRNLGRLGSIGLLTPFSEAEKQVVEKLSDAEHIRKSRLHPIALFNAYKVYVSGQGVKGSMQWNVNQKVSSALYDAFFMAFDFVEPTGKNFYLGLDVSGSMSWSTCANMAITPREASAIMALVTVKAEQNTLVKGFSSVRGPRRGDRGALVGLNITKHDNFDSVISKVSGLDFGATDCALPMVDALELKIPVDVFTVYTDNETWAGNVKPYQALRNYRDKMGIDAKLVVVAMTASGFTIADPSDAGMLDVVGFNTSTPQAISKFAAM